MTLPKMTMEEYDAQVHAAAQRPEVASLAERMMAAEKLDDAGWKLLVQEFIALDDIGKLACWGTVCQPGAERLEMIKVAHRHLALIILKVFVGADGKAVVPSFKPVRET